ncbi:MAG: manganese efflux pump [Clostridiales bacterium]|jgi:putative Mn2+ efflux pump MntP|nr:manganese efflux pump [Clostridiales bacterium]
MGILEIIVIAVGLSMDAFAAALCRGMAGKSNVNLRSALIIALFFGGFQALMPLTGWLLGRQFEQYIKNVDHWIAFGLLLFIGGKMIVEVVNKDRCPADSASEPELKMLFLLAVATSIDALAAGVTFAFLSVSILPAVLIIGVTTFVISLAGVFLGMRFGARFKTKAELLGGIVLILIGTKILLEHLGVL